MSNYHRDCKIGGVLLKERVKKYNVLEVAPLNKPLGIKGYSPIELVLSSVAEGLPKLKDRKITSYILAAKGSNGKNVIETVEAFGNWHGGEDKKFRDSYHEHFRKIDDLIDINIIHNHTVELPEFNIAQRLRIPVVNTVHISYKENTMDSLNKEGNFYVAISESHKRELEKRGIHVSRVVYNGINVREIFFDEKKEDYLLSIGRITSDKGQDVAIKAAKKAGQKIVIAGLVQKKPADQSYFRNEILPYIDLHVDFENAPSKGMETLLATKKQVIYCGEVGKSKYELYKKAKALIFPIQWEEPFGLVMVEALASGTPVLAYNRGSVPEIVEHGKSGYVFDSNLEDLVQGIKEIDKISHYNCRKRAENFSNERMVESYANFFEEILF